MPLTYRNRLPTPGSTFTKGKSTSHWTSIWRDSIIRVACLPLCADFWVGQTSSPIFIGQVCLYLILALTSIAFLTLPVCPSLVHPCDLLVPTVLLLLVSYIHSQLSPGKPDNDASSISVNDTDISKTSTCAVSGNKAHRRRTTSSTCTVAFSRLPLDDADGYCSGGDTGNISTDDDTDISEGDENDIVSTPAPCISLEEVTECLSGDSGTWTDISKQTRRSPDHRTPPPCAETKGLPIAHDSSDTGSTVSVDDSTSALRRSATPAESRTTLSLTTSHNAITCSVWDGSSSHRVEVMAVDVCRLITQRAEQRLIVGGERARFTFYSTLCVILPILLGALPLLPLIYGGSQVESCKAAGSGAAAGQSNSSWLVRYTPAILWGTSVASQSDVLVNGRVVSPSPLCNITQAVCTGRALWLSWLIKLSGVGHRVLYGAWLFIVLCAVEETLSERLWHAKYFGHLTSGRRARLSRLPHFRLNKVRHVRAWLNIRSYLSRRAPQRSVDMICQSAFAFCLGSALIVCLKLLKDYESFFNNTYITEASFWSMGIALYLFRLMVLGSKINEKLRNTSVLLTEQVGTLTRFHIPHPHVFPFWIRRSISICKWNTNRTKRRSCRSSTTF